MTVTLPITAVLRTIFESAMFCDEPTILNSNLLPVNAKGEVLFLSVLSRLIDGTEGTPSDMYLVSLLE